MDANGKVTPSQVSPWDFRSVFHRRTEAVRHFPMFSEISPEDCTAIVASAQERQIQRGKTIFFQGDPVTHVVLLTSGCVKLSQTGADGQEVILRLVASGECVNAENCTKCATHCSTARALEPSRALVWEARTFEAMADRFPLLRRNTSRDLQRLMNQLEDRYREVCTQKVPLRLSSELVRLAARVGKPSDGHVEIAISQRELAQLTGTTLFTVSRLLCQWAVRGIVKPRREAVVVLNVPALVELSQCE